MQFPNMFFVDVDKGPVTQTLNPLFLGDALANRIGVYLYKDGEPFSPGGSAFGRAVLSGGETVLIQNGVVSGNQIYVDLPSGVYAEQGPVKISVSWTNGTTTTTVLEGTGNVRLTETGTIIDPGTIISDVTALIQAIETAVASIPPEYTDLLETIAPVFSESVDYAAGQHVWYDGSLYRFTEDHSAGTWTGADATLDMLSATDTTLAVPGEPADAKATGDAIADLTEIVTKNQELINDVPVTLTSDCVINGYREVVSGVGSVYNVSGIITVRKGEKYLLSAHMNWRNYLYVFYDAAGTAFGGERSANDAAGTTWTDKIIIIPDNAVGIRLGVMVYTNVSYSFKKVTPAVVADILSDSITKIWRGKKWVAIGDSITAANATASEKYHYLIAQRTGITVLNYGRSGTGYGKTYDTSNNFANRVLELASVDCDIITIFGSFNDLSLELGTADDTGTATLGGWMNTTFDNLYATKPFVSVGVILPTPWWGRMPDGTTENSAKAVQYCEMLRTIAERRSIPVLDLFHRSNLHPNEENFRTQFYANADGVHPNNAGHAIFAPMIEQFLREIIPY